MILTSLNGLPAFLLYFAAAMALIVAFAFVYNRVTQHNEVDLIRDGNVAAAVAYGLSILGFAVPLASAISHSVNLVDMVIWGLIALAVQIGVYFAMRAVFPLMSEHIAEGRVASGLSLGLASLAAGLINAASMTY